MYRIILSLQRSVDNTYLGQHFLSTRIMIINSYNSTNVNLEVWL